MRCHSDELDCGIQAIWMFVGIQSLTGCKTGSLHLLKTPTNNHAFYCDI